MAYKYSYYLSRSKAEGIKAIGEDREQEVTVKYHGRFIVYYKNCQYAFMRPQIWSYKIYLSNFYDKSTKIYNRISILKNKFTIDSIKKSLNDYPTIWNLFFAADDIEVHYDVKVKEVYLIIKTKHLPEKECLMRLLKCAAKFERECKRYQYIPNKLLKKESLKSATLPQKVQDKTFLKKRFSHLLTMLGILGIKFFVKSLGSELDVDMPTDMLDISDKSDIPDSFDFSCIDAENNNTELIDSNSDFNNISFCGKNDLPPDANSDGYIPRGNISLDRSTCNGTEQFKLYTKDNSQFVLYKGNYIKITGHKTIDIGGISFRIKS